jgi:hypothetical protein
MFKEMATLAGPLRHDRIQALSGSFLTYQFGLEKIYGTGCA